MDRFSSIFLACMLSIHFFSGGLFSATSLFAIEGDKKETLQIVFWVSGLWIQAGWDIFFAEPIDFSILLPLQIASLLSSALFLMPFIFEEFYMGLGLIFLTNLRLWRESYRSEIKRRDSSAYDKGEEEKGETDIENQ